MRTLLLCLGLVSFAWISSYGQAIVIKEVLLDPSPAQGTQQRVEFCNTTGGTIDITNWFFCTRFNYPQLNAQTVLSGSLVLGGGQCVILGLNFTMNATSADLGLYTTSGFGNANNMHDFIQWGSGSDVGRTDVAFAKGIWRRFSPTNYDFIDISGMSEGESIRFDCTNGGANDETRSTDFSIGTPVNLPVELVTFEAKQIGEQVELAWETASEEDNAYFMVERSPNGQKFEEVGQIVGAGTSLSPQRYSFVDKAPIDGINYYRLRQVDLDGTINTHMIIAIHTAFKSSKVARIYPTLVEDEFQLDIYKNVEQARWSILDNNGNLLAQEQFGTLSTQVLTSNLASGHYLLRVELDGKMDVLRFIKL